MAKRRNRDGKYVEPEPQIFAEAAFLDHRRQVAVGRRDDTMQVSAEAGFDMGWTRNRNYNSLRLAPRFTALLGVGKPDGGWYIDSVFGYERAIANHVEHTEFYRDVFYEDAVDGWYYGTSGFFRMGLRTGVHVGRWDLEFRAAHDRTEKFRNTMGSPFTATVGAGVRW